MSIGSEDLGVLGNLAIALGLLDADGDPDPGWFGDPGASLATVLADDDQRAALIAFVDEAMGGADRTTDPGGAVWLPIVSEDSPDLTLAVTIDDGPADHVNIGIGARHRGTAPASDTWISVPLFKAAKVGRSVSSPFLLGEPGGRINLGTRITVDAGPPVPGEARLGSIGIEVDVPTDPADEDPAFALALDGFQLPGADAPRDIRISASGTDELDDAVLDLVLSLVRSQASGAPAGALSAVAGLLGLSGGAVPEFPIRQLATQGARALGTWLEQIVLSVAGRQAWLDHVATLFGGSRTGEEVTFTVGPASLRLGLRAEPGPSGHTRLTPTLGIDIGTGSPQARVRAHLCRIDLGSGDAIPLPSLGMWASLGRHDGSGTPVLDTTSPSTARVDTLRIGFELDAERRLSFVLAADGVLLGTRTYETLDLTSPDAVMDAAGNAVDDVATELLAHLGSSVAAARALIGLDTPDPTVPAVSLADLLTDPLGSVSGYWRALLTTHGAHVPTVLQNLRDTLADNSVAAAAIQGSGTAVDPWRVPLIGPVRLEAHIDGNELSLVVAADTKVDTLAARCTVVETRLAATLAVLDLQARTARLLPAVEGRLQARERGVTPPRVRLRIDDVTEILASHVGLRISWSAEEGLTSGVDAPGLTLRRGVDVFPITFPTIAADGSVTLPSEAWDAIQAILSEMGGRFQGPISDLMRLLGWTGLRGGPSLRLADLVDDPETALAEWLPELAVSRGGPLALSALADLFTAVGPVSGSMAGSGHPDDPYRLDLGGPGIPHLAAWFPPAGCEPRVVAAPGYLRRWRPGLPPLDPQSLANAILAEATVADDVACLAEGRAIADGLAALAARWEGGDGRITPPAGTTSGVDVERFGGAAGQLLDQLDLEDQLGRVPTTVVYVDIGPDRWPDAPADRRVDLTASGLAPEAFSGPTAAAGDWFVALGERAACRLETGDDDGTVGQAGRLNRVLGALAPLGNDLVVVGIGGAGHAARLAAESELAVSDVVTLGTPLTPISLTALSAQPTADALQLLRRLLPQDEAELAEPDLALGVHLVTALTELADRADPGSELRQPATALPTPRSGLAVTAIFGTVDSYRIGSAMTAVVAAGLARRARARARTPVPEPVGAACGLYWSVPSTTLGTLSVRGDARLTLASYDRTTGVSTGRELRVRLTVTDRTGWITSTPDVALRMLKADVAVRLSEGTGGTSIELLDARALGVDHERLVIGTDAEAAPLLPEARVLIGVAIQRLVADAASPVSSALVELLERLGLVTAGGAVPTAIEQLVHDPAGLVEDRLGSAAAEISQAIESLVSPIPGSIDLAAGTVTVSAGGPDEGRFGWSGELTASSASLDGRFTFGPSGPPGAAGGLELVVDLNPLTVELEWRQPSGTGYGIALWPSPDPAAIARALARAAPCLAAHVALELMRRADDDARELIEAVLDALGMLGGTVSDEMRPLRPLAGFLSDPAGWLRSGDSLATDPAKAQALFDALRPLLGLAGSDGDPLALATGVSLAVTAHGSDLRLGLTVDTGGWTAIGTALGRLVAGVGAHLTISSSGAPRGGLTLYVGTAGGTPGRQAVHAVYDGSSIQVFARPTSGADIPLIPFAGLGALAAAAERALPFLLDLLAAEPAPIGPAVGGVGDALGLRSGTPAKFDGDALAAWASDPAAALANAAPSIAAAGLGTLAPVIDAVLPAPVTASATGTSLSATIGAVTLTWTPTEGAVSVTGNSVAVPGLEEVSFAVTLSDDGVDAFGLTMGPADIDAGGVRLAPFVAVSAGPDAPSGRWLQIGLEADSDERLAARWRFDTEQFALIASDGPVMGGLESVDPTDVGLRVVEVVADLVASVALSTQAVQDALDKAVGTTTVRDLLEGVALDPVDTTKLIDDLFDVASVPARLQTLFGNLADASLSITVGTLDTALVEDSGVIGLRVALTARQEIVSGDVTLWLENDASWIEGATASDSGLFLGVTGSGSLAFEPSLAVYGLGLRIGRSSGPLLDLGLTLESIALHVFGTLDETGPGSGGLQIQFKNLAVSASSASGGNSIASGLLKDSGPQPPKPAFSPALAIQKHGNAPVHVTLRAGDGEGPWWIGIQKGFGPLYIEQVGLGVTMPQQKVDRISLLLDGSVSLFGLQAAVDDLQITYMVSRGDILNAANWDVDLAGLAVSADMAGLVLAGGLLKYGTPPTVEYLGSLLARFGVYGITIYGGYGEGLDPSGQKFVGFFAVGAIVGAIGGPPAFFVTGIGGGFGINRALVVPTDLSRFGDYPLIQALDVAATPGNPMDQLRSLGQYFPMERGTFWFAAGLSFNSFALVDGIAVVAVEVGDGLDINLLGLARMALPRPQVALVSIELALLARFSSSEGVLWVQGQLTDNSWLLYPDVRLTGGFAFVSWFKGENRGQFVLTIGGFHPDFHRPGYPVVPRLGIHWSLGSNIVVKAGGYFALTSEAVMAGGDFEASASFGPAWAEVKFGAHGIIYFDPFRYQVGAYARIHAGVTIDVWIGEITISISLGCSIEVEGPDFHGRATFEVGPIELTVEFGDSQQHPAPLLPESQFISKYLDPAPDGGARALAVITSSGAQAPEGDAPTPDGRSDRPFVVVAEFSLVLTTTVPATDVKRVSAASEAVDHYAPTGQLGVAPMGTNSIEPELEIAWRRSGTVLDLPFAVDDRPYGAFPLGVWGPPGDPDDRKVPKGDVVEALNELELTASATISGGGPEIPYHQVEIGPRRPLPFKRRAAVSAQLRQSASVLAGLLGDPANVDAAFATARNWMSDTASPTALAALRGERQAPPRFGTLGDGLDTGVETAVPSIAATVPDRVVDSFVYPPVVTAVLGRARTTHVETERVRTTVERAGRLWKTAPPSMASVEASRNPAIATKLRLVEPRAIRRQSAATVVARGRPPASAAGHGPVAAVASRGGVGRERLEGFTAALLAGRRVPRSSGTPGSILQPGEVVVMRMPNASRDVGDGPRPALEVRDRVVRLVALRSGGDVEADVRVPGTGETEESRTYAVPRGVERLAVCTEPETPGRGLVGWHAGMDLPYIGWSTALGVECTIRSRGERLTRHRERAGAGWVTGAELARGFSTIATRFTTPVTTVLVLLDDPEAFAPGSVDARRLVLGLDGAARATDADGAPIPPVLMASENRSILAYEVVPEAGGAPVTVTIASEPGWSVAGVLGTDALGPDEALGSLADRGVDAALRPVGSSEGPGARLVWRGPRSPAVARTDTRRPGRRG